MAEERIRLLIADDHPVVRAGLEGMISSEPDFEVVGEAEDGREAVELADRLSPDLILLDLRMPQMDGVVAISRIKANHPRMQILVLTNYKNDSDVLRAVEEGATGYLLKDVPRQELFDAIRTTARGEPLLSPSVTARLMHQVRTAGGEESLSPREIEVLDLVAGGKTNKDIARQLWVSETTVKSHLLHAFDKLGAADRAEAVAVALKKGILSLDSGQ